MLNDLSAILAGFSIVSAVVLLFAYLFFLPNMRKTVAGRFSCAVTLVGLALLQLSHYSYFIQNTDLLASYRYCTLLMLLPPSFFFFGREVLFPDVRYYWFDCLHIAPILLISVLPIEVLPGLSFLIGTGYTFWFARIIYQLRAQRSRFKFEMFFFGMFALMALVALVLGLWLPVIDHNVFYIAYSNAISIAMVLIVAALLVFPELLGDILLITELTYAKSKLSGINREQSELERLMIHERQFENEELSLASVAELLKLSSHQLSELINTEYGYGFPRLVREHRVRAAKSLLVAEPSASVLAISMMTGFKSQSSFYTAFKDSTGESPGSYRSKRCS